METSSHTMSTVNQSRSNVGDATIDGATPEHELETTTNASITARPSGVKMKQLEVDGSQ
jgi:hypothetical protein